MLWVIFTVTVLAGVLPAAEKKPKPPDIDIVEASAHRGESTISVEGRVRNTGEKPIKRLVLSFTFLAPGKQPLTTKKAEIDEELLDKGQEATFRMELQAPPRSVEFTVDASDVAGHLFRVGKTGPFPIQ
jgi:hypothetical protein